jgi:hypothetical protein
MTSMDLALRQVSDLLTWGHVGVFLLRVTAVAAAGSLGLGLLGRSSAAVRHRMAVATLAATLALPAAFLILPPLRLTLPAPKAATVDTPPHATGPLKITPAAFAAFDTKSGPRAAAGTERGRRGQRHHPAAAHPPPARAVAWRCRADACGARGAGLLWRALRAEWAARRLARRAVPITDPALRMSSGRPRPAEPDARRRTAPVSRAGCTGRLQVWSHTLLLPGNAAEWSATRRGQSCCELAHVQRRDGLWLALTRLAGTLSPPDAPGPAGLRTGVRRRGADAGLRSSSCRRISALAHESRGLWASAVAPAFAQLSTLESRPAAILSPGGGGRAEQATGGHRRALMALLPAACGGRGAREVIDARVGATGATTRSRNSRHPCPSSGPATTSATSGKDDMRREAAAPGEPCPSDEAGSTSSRDARPEHTVIRNPRKPTSAPQPRTIPHTASTTRPAAGAGGQASQARTPGRAVEASFDQLELLASDETRSAALEPPS